MTVVVDANILIAFGLADEPLHAQAHWVLTAWRTGWAGNLAGVRYNRRASEKMSEIRG
jgi:predicted nucleic acid-binding protein